MKKPQDVYMIVNGYAVSIEQIDQSGKRTKNWHMYIDGAYLTDFRTKADAIKYAKTEIYK